MADEKKAPITLSNLRPAKGSTQYKKRVGRGVGSGLGKTSGKGHKGHKARTGGATNPGFEGGQMPMFRRLPKRGFHNPEKVAAQPVNLKDLTRMSVSEINPDTLTTAGLITRPTVAVKLLGTGDVSKAYKVRGVAVSASAKAKIEAAGGSVEA